MGPDQKGLSRTYILREVEASLKRLETDYIDLYQSHTDDQQTPLQETLETYSRLIEQGKVRAIGASNYTAERLFQALEVSKERRYPRYESLQPLYNLVRSCRVRDQTGTRLPGERIGSHSLFFFGERISDWKVSL